MDPKIILCPTCQNFLVLSEEISNEAYCHKCDLQLNWKQRGYLDTTLEQTRSTNVIAEEFSEDSELLPEIFFEYANYEDATNQKKYRRFTKLGHATFNAEGTRKRQITRYEHLLFDISDESEIEGDDRHYLQEGLLETPFDEQKKRLNWKVPKFIYVAGTLLLIPIIWGSSYYYYQHKLAYELSEIGIVQDVPDISEFKEAEAQSCLVNFFNAESWEDAYQYVLPDPTLKSVMKKYWVNETVSNMFFLESEILEDGETASYFYGALTEEGSQHFYYVLYNEKFGLKIDWRESNFIDDMPIEAFIEDQPKEPVLLRGNLKALDFYRGGYTKETHAGYEMSGTQDGTIIVYIRRDSDDYEKLTEEYEKEILAGRKTVRATAKVTLSPDNKNFSEISEILSLSTLEDQLERVYLPYLEKNK